MTSVGGGLRKITRAGYVTTVPVKQSPGEYNGSPSGGIEADKAGNLYVADPMEHVIRKITRPVSSSPWQESWGPPEMRMARRATHVSRSRATWRSAQRVLA